MSNYDRTTMKQIRGNFNGFENPRIAGSVRIHRKEWESEIQRKISEFQQGEETRLAFIAMENSQRKRVHEIAGRHGLLSHSEGRDPNRFVVLHKKKKPALTSSLTIETEPVELNPASSAKIREFMKEFPIGKYDVDCHLSVNMARKGQRNKNHAHKFDRPQPMLLPPKSMSSNAMLEQRRRLPAFNMRSELLQAIHRNRVVLITGGTGCGKTTQVPQFLLEEAHAVNIPLRIICTQPRRLPAIAVAERVAKERGEYVGGTVGYHIRLESKTSSNTILTYCTSGVLLRMLTQDDAFKNVSHIILDEIHEREQNTDYLLIALKQALAREKDLKIVLMSATMEGNLDIFKNYFGEVPVQHIDIPSRLYNVEKFFLGDILALTGYTPPESVFSSSNFATMGVSQSFPQMSNWETPDEQQPMQMHQSTYAEPSKKPTFDVGVPYSTPPPTRPVQSNLFNNLAQQLTTSQAAPQQNQNVPQYTQGGMHHAATWASGMNQAQYGDYQPNQECIEYQPTSEDLAAVQSAFGDSVVPSGGPFPVQNASNMYSTPPPDWNRYQPPPSNEMQYFNHPMDGRVFPQPVSQTIAGVPFGQPHPFGGAPMTQQAVFSSPFGRAIREERELIDKMRCMLQMSLPNRTPLFHTDSMKMLKQGLASQGLQSEQLAEAYKKLGGQQYTDCVDVDLVTALARYIMDSPIEGAILIFLPGYDDIVEVKERLMEACRPCQLHPDIYTLHSQMNTSDQHKVFERSKEGFRKVILSTNIAEASLTIDDVVFVIDSGKVKEKTYDHNSRISQLKVCWIARSNAEQRSGRAGRCREGFCFRLYGQGDFNMMPATQKAEMQRAAIHEVCLHAKIFAPEGMSVRNFLSMAPEPPPSGAIDNSMQFLEQLGAFYSEASTSDVDVSGSTTIQIEPEMTDLGLVIAKLPLDPQLARMLLFGLALKVLTPIVTLVAALSHRDPFVIPIPDERERCNKTRDTFCGMDYSDHLALLRAITAFEQCRKHEQAAFCRNNFLNLPAMKMILGIRKQLLGELKRANLIVDATTALDDIHYNQYSDRWPMVEVAITAGCYPGIAFTKAGTKLRKIRTFEKSAGLHPSSVIKRQIIQQSKKNELSDTKVEYLAYQELAQLDEGLTLKTVTVVPPVATILGTGLLRLKLSLIHEFSIICEPCLLEVEEELEKNSGEEDYQHHFGQPAMPFLVIDDWFACKGSHPALRDILRLRFHLMKYFLDVIAEPASMHTTNEKYGKLLDTLATVLDEDHGRVGFKYVEPKEFFNKEKRQYYADEKNYSNDTRSHYNDGGRHNNNRGYYKQDRDHQHGQSQKYEHNNKDFLLNSGYTNCGLPNQGDDRTESDNYNSKDNYRNGAGYDTGARGGYGGQRASPRYNDEYNRSQSPRYYSRPQSPRYNPPPDDDRYDEGYGRRYPPRNDGRRSYSPREYYENEPYDPPEQEPYYEDRGYRSQRDGPDDRYDDRRYNDQRRDDMPNRNYGRDYPRRGGGPGRPRRGDGNMRGRGSRGNFHNKQDFNQARGGRNTPEFKPSSFIENISFDDEDDDDYAPPSRTSPVNFSEKAQDIRAPSSVFPAKSQDVRFEQGKAPPSYISPPHPRNQQSTSRDQNYNRDRDDRAGYNQQFGRNNRNYNSRKFDDAPRRQNDEPRRQDDGSRRQNDGFRGSNDGSTFRRQDDAPPPRRQEDSGRRDGYKNDNYGGYNGGRRNDNRSKNEAAGSSQKRNDRGNYDDAPPRQNRHRRSRNKTRSDKTHSDNSNSHVKSFQPPPQGGNNRKPRNSPNGEDPPPDPVIRNDGYRNSTRARRKFIPGRGGGGYRGGRKNENKNGDGGPYVEEDEAHPKDKKPMVFENSKYKRNGPSNRQ